MQAEKYDAYLFVHQVLLQLDALKAVQHTLSGESILYESRMWYLLTVVRQDPCCKM